MVLETLVKRITQFQMEEKNIMDQENKSYSQFNVQYLESPFYLLCQKKFVLRGSGLGDTQQLNLLKNKVLVLLLKAKIQSELFLTFKLNAK
ncbi:unnamed protein product [Paramecium pentaurelia]|uniref:Uncharacterized protein n=1 Tax=Paramecium pentaurelia TaxID=43138 RepID=A0A8S1VLZ5_9CILI|nr:unnamed protein product [Paramecium pentaurelia]